MQQKKRLVSEMDGFVRRRPLNSQTSRPQLDPFGKNRVIRPNSGLEKKEKKTETIGLKKDKQKAMTGLKFDLEIEDTEEKPKKKRFFRGGKESKPISPRRKKIKRIALAGLALLLLAGGVYGFSIYKKIFRGGSDGALALQGELDTTKLKGEGDGRVNILLLGRGGEGHDGPDLTDTIVIASIDPFAKEVALVSLPRDLWVRAPSYGYGKINSVYANAKYANNNDHDSGIKSLEETIKDTIGINIHYYAMVDFKGFEQAINTVGGIEFEVKEPLYDITMAWQNNNNPLIAGQGWQKFDGKRALMYARSRMGSARGDFDRNQRQREVLLALKDKIFSLGTFSNPIKVLNLINSAGSNVQTDVSSAGELKRLYDIGKDVPGDKVESIGLADEPNDFLTTGNIGGASVVLPKAGVGKYDDIKNFLRGKLVDGFIKKEAAKIVVLNGTGVAGLATSKANDLKSYGYQIISVGDYESTTQTTRIIEVNKDKAPATKKYLENRFKVSASNGSIPQGQPMDADFVIILGKDVAVSQ